MQINKTIIRLILVSASVLLIYGCGGYGGGHQVVNKSKHVDTTNYVKIECVKGLSIRYIPKQVSNPKLNAIKHVIKPGVYRSLSVPPGEHTFELILKDGKRKHTKRVNVTLKADTHYKVHYQAKLFSADFWISEKRTGKIIYDSRKL